MMPLVDELENQLDALIQAIEEAIANGEEISPEIEQQLIEEISLLNQEIEDAHLAQEAELDEPFLNEDQVKGFEQPEPPPAPVINQGLGEAPIPAAQLLWILSGQQPEVFVQYLKEFPSPETQNLLNNPTELERNIVFLSRMMPQGTSPTVDGIEKNPLNSSNVWGSKFDPQTGRLLVKFRSGSVYEYDGVPENIYKAFQQGSASAKTNGRNQYGVWWVGKNPSLGAALNQYIKAAGFPYRRLR